MAAVLDILDDVNQKFTGTMVMFNNKAHFVKSVSYQDDDKTKFILQLAAPQARQLDYVSLTDPKLNYQNFNIGYANANMYSVWWYRNPHKQWSQGLKSSQMGWRMGQPGANPPENFNFGKSVIAMLENRYPDLENCKKTLMQGDRLSVAFHRDFALSFDDLHEDFLLEYHGVRIGTSLDKELKQFKIKSEARHLIEALHEARNVHP